jgi:hypothetical protein
MTVYTERIMPRPEARILFSSMVAKADADLVLDLESTIELCIERKYNGQSIQAEEEMNDLLTAGWVAQHSSGGWILAC